MDYLVTASEMKRADRETMEYFGIPELVLMENAARETARYITENFSVKKRVLILAGGGNNGGDGMAVGRILHQKQYSVTVIFCAAEESMTAAARQQKHILEQYGVTVTDQFLQTEYDIIIDAIFGIGLSREVTGYPASILKQANASDAYRIACDIPSGIACDTGQVLGTAFCADLTITYGFIKRGLVLYPGAAYTGKILCVDIGISTHSFRGEYPSLYTFAADHKPLLPKRPAYSHKGSIGKALLIAGSKNMSGACELAATALYRTGVGMVRVVTAEENRLILQQKVPEAILLTYEQENGSLVREEQLRSQLAENLAWCDCVIAGCGISTMQPAKQLLTLLLTELAQSVKDQKEAPQKKGGSKKLVLDADALNLLAADETLKGQIGRLHRLGCEIALTPHLQEFARILGRPVAAWKPDLVAACMEFVAAWNVVTVCKDARTLVGLPEGTAYLNTTGNSGMATAGSGDVLSGIIGGLAAQGMAMGEAAVQGVYLHGAAGDLAAAKMGEYAMMAHDITGQLSQLLR